MSFLPTNVRKNDSMDGQKRMSCTFSVQWNCVEYTWFEQIPKLLDHLLPFSYSSWNHDSLLHDHCFGTLLGCCFGKLVPFSLCDVKNDRCFQAISHWVSSSRYHNCDRKRFKHNHTMQDLQSIFILSSTSIKTSVMLIWIKQRKFQASPKVDRTKRFDCDGGPCYHLLPNPQESDLVRVHRGRVSRWYEDVWVLCASSAIKC